MRIVCALRLGLFCVLFAASSCLAATRHYYIAAEDISWNYAPSGHNLMNGNPISNVTLTSEMLLAPNDLQRPFTATWQSSKPISPGEEPTLEKPGSRSSSAQTVMGWVFFPSGVKYQDGSSWHSESEGECFGTIWRDEQHPDMPALPPRQIEMNPD